MKFLFKEELNSTNAYAKEHMSKLDDMTFLYCNRQTGGKGRLNRVWVSDNEQNIYLTIILKPESPDYPYINLTQYLCVTACEVLKQYGVEPRIKWPNDILINGRKIAGILAQTSTTGQKINGVALGIGINLNSDKKEMEKIDKPATSLNLEIGKSVDRDEFLQKLAQEFEKGYKTFVTKGFETIENEYMSLACFINKEITVNVSDKSLVGTAKSLTKDGALILCDNKTKQELVITMGEIQ